MAILFNIILFLLIVVKTDGCMQTPMINPSIVLTKTTTIAPTTAATTATATIATATSTNVATTTTTPLSTTSTTPITTSTTTTSTPTTTTTSTTTTTAITTTTTPIPCVPPAGSAGITISASDLVTGIAAAGAGSIPVSGSCACGDNLRAFSPGQAAPLPTPNAPNWAIELCNPTTVNSFCTCNDPCACTYGGQCYVIATDPASGDFTSDVFYYPFSDGTFYAYIQQGAGIQTFDDQTGKPVTLPIPFQVAAAGCFGCPALRSSLALSCTITGPFIPAV